MKVLEGKKTYLAAVLLAVLAIAGFWFGVLDAVQSGAMLASALAVFGMRDALGRLVAQGIIDAVAKAKEERSAGLSATAELQSFDFVAPQVDVEALAKELRRQFASGEYVSAPEKKAE